MIQVPKSPAYPSGGSGGYRGDYLNQPFTARNGYSSTYHIWASHITGTDPKGIAFYFHGDGHEEFDTFSESDNYIGTILSVARQEDLILVALKTPDDQTGTWWEWWGQEQNARYAYDLMKWMYSIHNVNLNDVWLYGWSGGSEFITAILLPYFGSDLIRGGGAIMTGGGTSPDPSLPQNYPLGSFSMHWWAGFGDIPENNYDGFDGKAAARRGYDHYLGKVTEVRYQVVPDMDHDLAPHYGSYLANPLLFGYRNAADNSLVGISSVQSGDERISDIYLGDEWLWTKPEADWVYRYTTAGTRYIRAPEYECEIDVYAVGGGGGGRVGYGDNGNPGSAGQVGSAVINTLTGIRGGEIKVVVGSGGAGGNGSRNLGIDGGESSVAIGFLSVKASGGVGGGKPGDRGTQSAAYYGTVADHFGYSHQVVTDEKLGRGGAGGDGGILGNYENGEDGNQGYVWLRVRKVTP